MPAVNRSGNTGLLLLGGLGIGAYLLYKNTASAQAAARGNGLPTGSGLVSYLPAPGLPGGLPIQAGTVNIPELPGAGAVNAPQVAGAVGFWNSLSPANSLSAGYVNFPSGSQAAASLFPTRMDQYGAPYVQWAGLVYILTGPDASGNYTATQVQTG